MNKLILIIVTLICMCNCTEQIRDNPMTPDYIPVTKNFKKVISGV